MSKHRANENKHVHQEENKRDRSSKSNKHESKRGVKSLQSNKNKSFLSKLWHFMWNSDSLYSLIFDLVIAFVLIKYVIYPVIGVTLHTDHPVVAIVSGSMEHFPNDYGLCGVVDRGILSSYKANFTNWWKYCGSWYVLHNITINEFGRFPFKDGLNKGDLVVLKGVKPSQLKVGDVIVFRARNGEPIIHRLIKINNVSGRLFLQTKGDDNPYSMPTLEFNISPSSVIGVAVYKIPYLGYVKVYASEFVDFFRGKSHG